MAKSAVQFQPGMSLPDFLRQYRGRIERVDRQGLTDCGTPGRSDAWAAVRERWFRLGA